MNNVFNNNEYIIISASKKNNTNTDYSCSLLNSVTL